MKIIILLNSNKVTPFLRPQKTILVRYGEDLTDTICWMSRIRNKENYVPNVHLSCGMFCGRGAGKMLRSMITSIWFLFIYRLFRFEIHRNNTWFVKISNTTDDHKWLLLIIIHLLFVQCHESWLLWVNIVRPHSFMNDDYNGFWEFRISKQDRLLNYYYQDQSF